MIISHRHRFVFVAIPKTGTHAIRGALRRQLGAGDLEQVGLFVKKTFPFEPLARLKHGHISLIQVRPFLGEPNFSSYFKFAFVRNPFDRFISYCAFMTRADNGFARDPQAVMRRFLFESRPLDHLLFVPQHTFITDERGALLADAVGRVENMQVAYDGYCERLGLQSDPLARVNSSQRGDYRLYYDNPMRDAVEEIYRGDLEMFGYDFEGQAG
ncbi:MAG TPA: sulfotransferase [Hyphomonadaceae bacterium]|nr:sulfotransferase [Hyphomonadaceae bacterium]